VVLCVFISRGIVWRGNKVFRYYFVLEKRSGIQVIHGNELTLEKAPLINSSTKYFTIREKLALQIELIQYTGPLFLVYFGEYVINQGITPVLTFNNSPLFAKQEYKYYSFIYQIGVFISRSSANFFQIKQLWLLAFLQIANMIFLGCAAYFNFIPSIWIIFAIVLYEGLIGGAVFVNAFYRVAAEVEDEKKEFCMSSISFWYSCGILLAGVAGQFTQPWLKSIRNPPGPAPEHAPAPAHVPTPKPQPASVPRPASIPQPATMPLPASVPVPA